MGTQNEEMARLFHTKYRDAIKIVEQQTMPQTQGLCMESYESGAEKMDRTFVGVTTMSELSTESQDIPVRVINTRKSWLYTKDYALDMFERRPDKLRMMLDPRSQFIKSQVAAKNRTKDKVLIAALNGVAWGDKNGTTQVAFPAATNQIVNGGAGLNLTKLRQARKGLKKRGFLQDGQEQTINVLWTTYQEDQFLDITQFTSRDFTGTLRWDDKEVKQASNWRFVRIEDLYDEDGVLVERLLPHTEAGGVRSVFAYVSDAMERNTAFEEEGTVTWEQGRRAWRVSTDVTVGASRHRNYGVYQIDCTEPQTWV